MYVELWNRKCLHWFSMNPTLTIQINWFSCQVRDLVSILSVYYSLEKLYLSKCTFHLLSQAFLTFGFLIIMEGLGICGYFSSSSGLQSNSSSSSSELWERLRLGGGDSKHGASPASCRWQIEFELVPFTFLVLVECVEIQLTVLWACSCCRRCCCSCRLTGRPSGWDVTGSAAGSPWLLLLRLALFGSWAGAGSVFTSDG